MKASKQRMETANKGCPTLADRMSQLNRKQGGVLSPDLEPPTREGYLNLSYQVAPLQ